MVVYASTPPFDPRQRLQAAVALLQQGRLQEAWIPVNAVLAADPDNAFAVQLRGLILAQVGQVAEAADDFARAVALNPSDPAGHNNLANALRALGRVEESLAACERALALVRIAQTAIFSIRSVSHKFWI